MLGTPELLKVPSSFFTAGAVREGVIDGDCCVNKDYRYENKRAQIVNQSCFFCGEEEVISYHKLGAQLRT